MKNITFIILLACPIFLFSQIENGDFNEWEIIDGIERPISWRSNQNDYANNIQKITEGGNTWIKFLASQQHFNCGAYLQQTIDYPFGSEVISFDFDIRTKSFQADSSTILRVYIDFTNKNYESINSIRTEINTVIKEFTHFTIPIEEGTISDRISIRFYGGSILAANDGCLFNSHIELDNVKFTLNPISDFKENEFIIYPNPVDNTIYIRNLPDNTETIKIINSLGNIVIEDTNNCIIDVSTLPPGIYYLMINEEKTKKFVVI